MVYNFADPSGPGSPPSTHSTTIESAPAVCIRLLLNGNIGQRLVTKFDEGTPIQFEQLPFKIFLCSWSHITLFLGVNNRLDMQQAQAHMK